MTKPYNVTLKTIPWKIRTLAELKRDGKLHLPDLQRGFVWSPERVLALHDSLYRKYPVGALLLWKPTWEGDETPFATRAFDIWPAGGEVGRGVREPLAPVEPGHFFILDGQQRLTSLFRVIFRSRARAKPSADPDLLVSLSSVPEWVERPFYLRSRAIVSKMRDGLLVPADTLFEGVRGGNESQAITRAIADWVPVEHELFFKALDRANVIRNAILEAEILAYEIDADADDDNVIEIFARLNQQGVRLRPADLAAARLTGRMANFRQRARESLRSPSLKGFVAFEGEEERQRTGAFIDTDLIVRTALYLGAGVVRYREVERRKAGLDTAYDKVEEQWDKATDGLAHVAGQLRAAGVPSGNWLPYRYLLLPLAVCVAKTGSLDANMLIAWIVSASLWGHYAGEAETKLQQDAKAAEVGDLGKLLDRVKAQAKRTESVIPEESDFTGGVVAERGVYLALLLHLVRCQGRSFPTGMLFSTHAEPIEVHHIFPRAVLERPEYRDNRFEPDRLGNLTLLYGADNLHIGQTPPAEYLPQVSPEQLVEHAIPADSALWEVEAYHDFCDKREAELTRIVADLLTGVGAGNGTSASAGVGLVLAD